MIQPMFENSVRMAIFSKIKTDNPVIDTFISTIILHRPKRKMRQTHNYLFVYFITMFQVVC